MKKYIINYAFTKEKRSRAQAHTDVIVYKSSLSVPSGRIYAAENTHSKS